MGITITLHGRAGAGKSSLALTAPSPTLLIDAESAWEYSHRVTDGQPVFPEFELWDDPTTAPPSNPKDVVVVSIRKVEDFENVLTVLRGGGTPFRSVIVDSLTEIQKYMKDSLAGTSNNGLPELQHWAIMKTALDRLIRQMRDLTDDPKSPIDAVVFVSLTDTEKEPFEPLFEGSKLQVSLNATLAACSRLVGYVGLVTDDETGQTIQRLWVTSNPKVLAKNNLPFLLQEYGPVIDNPNLGLIIDKVKQARLGQPSTSNKESKQ